MSRRTLLAALAGWLTAGGLGVVLWRRRPGPARSTETPRGAAWPAAQAAPSASEADRSRGGGGTGTESAPAPHERPEPTDRSVEAEQRGVLTERPVSAEALRIGHQPQSDTPARWVVLFLVLVFASIAVAMVTTGWFFDRTAGHRAAEARAAATPFGDVRAAPAEPRLQSDPALDLAALRAAEDHVLSTYGRAPGGGLRVPIDRAMALVVADGFPVDTSLGLAPADRVVPTESGWTRARVGPRPAVSPAYPGAAPDDALRGRAATDVPSPARTPQP